MSLRWQIYSIEIEPMLPNIKFTLLILLTGFLFACNRLDEKSNVTFAVFGEPAEFAAYEELVNEFEQAHPEIDIQIRHTPGQSEYRRRLATEFASGSPSDVFLLNYRRFAAFAAEGVLEPLGPYLENSNLIQPSDFYEITLDAFRYRNQLWCIPQNLSSLVVYYNRNLFDEAGLAYPAHDWTWEQFLETARELTQDHDEDGRFDQYGAGLAPNLFRLAPFVWQNGGALVDDYERPSRLTIDSPEARQAFQWFVDLQLAEHVVPNARQESAESSESRFLNGILAMYFNSRRGVPAYRSIINFQWDVAPLPRNLEPAGILHSDAFCLSAAAENKEAAWRFIEFSNSQTGQEIIAKSGRTVPSLKSVAQSSLFLSLDLPPANSRIYLDSISDIRMVPITPSWVPVEEQVAVEIEKAFYGEVSVDQAIQNAVRIANKHFVENR